jgi:hypothetical protein
MAKKKETKYKSFGNYGLRPSEEKNLIIILEEKDLRARYVVKQLLRAYIKSGGVMPSFR